MAYETKDDAAAKLKGKALEIDPEYSCTVECLTDDPVLLSKTIEFEYLDLPEDLRARVLELTLDIFKYLDRR